MVNNLSSKPITLYHKFRIKSPVYNKNIIMDRVRQAQDENRVAQLNKLTNIEPRAEIVNKETLAFRKKISLDRDAKELSALDAWLDRLGVTEHQHEAIGEFSVSMDKAELDVISLFLKQVVTGHYQFKSNTKNGLQQNARSLLAIIWLLKRQKPMRIAINPFFAEVHSVLTIIANIDCDLLDLDLETKQNSQTGLTTDVFDVNHSVYKWIMLLQTIKEHVEFLDCEGDELAQLASINCDWLVSLAYKPTSTGRKPYSMVEGVSDLDDHTNDD